ncbi:LOW QUALITY PROTEIN: hypothetical protein CsSME_00008290 [Camellia sinensis var. sinensis]
MIATNEYARKDLDKKMLIKEALSPTSLHTWL